MSEQRQPAIADARAGSSFVTWLARFFRQVRAWGRRFIEAPPIAHLAGAAGWFAAFGTHGYDADTRRRLKILNLIAYLAAATTLIYAVQHTQQNYATFANLIWVNALLGLTVAMVPLMHRFSPIAGGLLIVGAEWIGLTMITALLGTNSGVHYQFFVAAAAPFVVFGLERIGLVLATALSGLALHFYCAFALPADTALVRAHPEMVTGIYVQAIITTAALISATVWYAFGLLEVAKADNDRLLRNILPDEIADRLKARPGEIIADRHPNAVVLFADIAGFVALAKTLGPERIVGLLNEMISAFDALAEQHGIEKIKTIGDAYMAVAGVPAKSDDPTGQMARFARALLSETERMRVRHQLDLSLRIGMARGPLTAGVIGKRKFSFDVWGDTVNLASRLESRSQRGYVLVCPQCYEALEGRFELTYNGELDIKGLGLRPVWYLGGPIEGV